MIFAIGNCLIIIVMWGRTYSRRSRARDVRRAAERAEHARVSDQGLI
jgi:hypothetical protein